MTQSASLADPSVSSIESLAKIAGADLESGLAPPEALLRLSKHGPNELRPAPPVPAWRRLIRQFQDPLVYLLLAAVAVSLAAWAVEGRQGWPIDALVIAIVVLLNGALGYIEEARAQGAVAALARMTQAHSSVIRGGDTLRVPSAGLVVGDLLVLDEGDAVGADARLVSAAALHVQEASLTGESHAVLKHTEALAAPAALGDRLNMVFKGTMVVQGHALAVVTATGRQTEMGAIAGMLERTADAPTPLEKEISRIGRMLGLAVMVIAAVVVGSILWLSGARSADEVIKVLLLGVALAVAAVPEGLPAILSVVLALGVRRMAGSQAIVKKLSSVETLGSATVICTDKTGTLTRSEMTIVRIVTASGTTGVTGVGYAPDGRIEYEGAPITPGPLFEEQAMLLGGGCLAGNAGLGQAADGQWVIQGDPTEAAFWVAERKLGVSAQRQTRFERMGQIPFTSTRKMMSTIETDHAHGDRRVIITRVRRMYCCIVAHAATGGRHRAHGRGQARTHSGGRGCHVGCGATHPCSGLAAAAGRRRRACRRTAGGARTGPDIHRDGGHDGSAPRGSCRGHPGSATGGHTGHHDHGRPSANGCPHRGRPGYCRTRCARIDGS